MASFCFPPLNLGIDDLYDVLEKLTDVAHKWKNIGLALRLRPAQLNTIKRNNSDDMEGCLTDMLELWLMKTYDVETHGEPSWRLLREAVGSKAGGNNPALAETLPHL